MKVVALLFACRSPQRSLQGSCLTLFVAVLPEMCFTVIKDIITHCDGLRNKAAKRYASPLTTSGLLSKSVKIG